MFEELHGKEVKITFMEGDKESCVFGILLGDDETTYKIQFRNGEIIGIGKARTIKIFPKRKEGE